jgi:hypothetical protein
MNRVELQQLAQARIAEADVLLQSGQFSGAYYLAGYAVECALKACIAKLMKSEEFPDRDFARDCWSHDFNKLMRLTQLEMQHGTQLAANPLYRENWLIAKDWTEGSRNQMHDAAKAQQLYNAIVDPTDGVLSWIMTFW